MFRAMRTARLAQAGRGVIDAFAAAVTAAVETAGRHREFAFALAATALFYLPALRSGSDDAGFLYGGDVLGFVWPSMVKAHALLSSWNFTALDLSLFNGSADFFFSANFHSCHPILVLYSLFTSPASTSMRDLGLLLVLMLAFHSFIACYFTLKLLTRFFAFDFGAAGFAAVTFGFSVFMLNSLNQPMFVFSTSTVAWSTYGALAFEARPSLRAFFLGSLPVVITYLGGYVPLGVASLMFVAVFVASRLLYVDNETKPLRERARSWAVAMVPFAGATLVVAPYLFSVYQFYADSPASKARSLFFSAHQLAEPPQALLRLLSTHLDVPGPVYEFSVTWGIIAVVIATLFLLCRKPFEELSARDWKTLKVSAVLYFAAVLAIFGEFSVMSDLVYHLVPQVGSMHIYQRFLLPAQLFLGVLLALMLKALVQSPPMGASRIALAALAAATLATAYIVARNPALTKEMGINGYIVIELALAFLFVFALMVPGKAFAYAAAIVLSCLPALDHMYDYTNGGNTLTEQRKRLGVLLDESERARLVSYLKTHSRKALVKYVDLTPLWTGGIETFPKSFPYFVLHELDVSSYGGFSFYLSTRADYMRRMPIAGNVEMSPDWDLVAASGADFVVARESDLKSGALANRLAGAKSEDIFRLANGVVFVPLTTGTTVASPPPAFDNGYFRIEGGRESDRAKTPKLENVALGKKARQSSTAGGGDASRAVDGNTDGAFLKGSVAHTGRDANAWIEIDLGAVESIDSVKVWNRTDCCGFRLNNYWLFISSAPFGDKDTAAALRTRADTWHKINSTPNPSSTIKTAGARGRYVRIQLEANPADEIYLHLAEIEVFRADSGTLAAEQANRLAVAPAMKVLDFTTNKANHMHLELESSGPATVKYLLWKNPRLGFFLNGERANVVERDGLAAIEVPAGRTTIDVRYRHWMLTFFWIVYGLFGVGCAWALAASALLYRKERSGRPIG